MAGMRRLKVVNVVISRTVFNAHIEREEATASPLKDVHTGYDPRGGALGYFLGGYVPPGTPNWHPVLEKISLKIDTPF